MRLFSATLATETNTFAPLPTSLRAFQASVWLRPGEHPEDAPRMCTAPLFVARRRAAAEGFTLIEGSCFAASPAGIVNRDAYETMRDEILAQVTAGLPLDAVVLGLHGAMVAQDYDDVEGDMIERVRAIVGDGCVIGVELDPHCHMTRRRVRAADVIVCYKEFPHTDVADRADDLLDIVLAAVRGEVRPVMSLYDCRQVSSYPTQFPLMRGFVERMKALEGRDGILSISAVHCFPYADVPEMGGRMLVVADGDKAKADALATRLGEEFVAMRGRTMPEFFTVESGVAAAMAAPEGPIVIAEPTDNAGGGAPSDNTSILRELLSRGATSAAVGPIWDPIAVGFCFDAGLNGRFPLRFGGKTAPASGVPVDAVVEVTGLARDAWQTFGPTRVPVGDCAAVRVDGVEAVLIANRTQAFGLDLFRNVGIEPTERQVLVVKSTNHFAAAFGPIARRVIFVDSDGPLARDYKRLAYTKVQRPIWPLDDATQPSLII